MTRRYRQTSAVEQAVQPDKVSLAKKALSYPPQRGSSPKRPDRFFTSRRVDIYRPVFFSIRLYEVNKTQPPSEWEEAKELKAGHKYSVVLVGETNGPKPGSALCPQGIVIEDSIELRISLPMEVQKHIGKPYWEETLVYQQARQLEEEIARITIAQNHPTELMKFSLSYRESAKKFRIQQGTSSIVIQGTYSQEGEALLKSCQVNKELPEGTVVLRVADDVKQGTQPMTRLVLRVWSNWLKHLEIETCPAVLVSVAQLQQLPEKLPPEEIVANLALFSRTLSSKFIEWLYRHVQKYGERLGVIIVDTTTLETPWEMLKLDDEVYLGTTAQVVRWRPFQCFAQTKWLEVKPARHTGSVVSYLDSTLDHDKIRKEQRAIRKLVREDYATLTALEERIQQPLKNIGLIYIGCHGWNGQGLGQRQRPVSQRLKSIRLELLESKTEPLTVFVNACASARIVADNRIDPSSFVEGFLTHCASGYIGTLAAIDIQIAAEIAGHILEAALNPDGARITEILRQIRSEAVVQLKQASTLPLEERRKAYLKVIDKFMYVYYGNPKTHLYLREMKREEEEA